MGSVIFSDLILSTLVAQGLSPKNSPHMLYSYGDRASAESGTPLFHKDGFKTRPRDDFWIGQVKMDNNQT